MTEQEKASLAGLCRIEIKRWKAASESDPNRRYMVELMEIALATLTAPQPCKHQWISSQVRTSSGWLCKVCGDYEGPTAPQVKKVKLPKKQKPKESAHPDMHTLAVGWNECIDHFEGILRAAWIEVEE